MSLSATPPNNLAAVGLIRAVAVDDPDSGLLIISQHGGCKPGPEGDQVTTFMIALAALAAPCDVRVQRLQRGADAAGP